MFMYAVPLKATLTLLNWSDLCRQNARQVIHPESEENVQNIREEIQQQRQANQSSTANGAPSANQTTQTNAPQPMRTNDGDQQCPVCLADAQFAVQTNCGHLFCGKYIFLTLVLLNQDIPCLCKQCRCRSVSFFKLASEEAN